MNEDIKIEDIKLVDEPSPHLVKHWTTSSIMGNVLIALVPAVLGSIFLFGPRVIPFYLIAIASCLAAEVLCMIVKKEEIILDYSPVVTGTLLAMSLPADVPLWFPALGGAIAIIVAKQLFGGIGNNFLNPAVAGRFVLRIVFVVQMTQNAVPNPPFGMIPSSDAVSTATPLAVIKSGEILSWANIWDSFLGLTPGKLGETSAILLLIGAAYLVFKGIIKLRIPLAMLGSIAVMAFIFAGPDGLFSAGPTTIIGNLIGGATILGAFFMATDYSSSPTTPRGEIIFGILVGVVTMAFRLWSSWPEGFTFALIIVNFTVPFIDYFVRPKALGETQKRAS